MYQTLLLKWFLVERFLVYLYAVFFCSTASDPYAVRTTRSLYINFH